MIIFRKVRWRNVLSYGQGWTEIRLDKSPSTMVLGSNGAGKSTLADALVYGLFGKPFRKIKKGQLINTKNGRDLLVEIEFEADGVPYLVRRGMKPDIFEIHRNGELLNQPGLTRDYQKQFETSVLKMDYQAACQIVFVGKAQHTTFMQLDSAKRRQFVEVMLNLVVFSNMSKILYNKSSELRSNISELKTSVTVSKEKVLLRERYIRDLEAAEKQSHEAEVRRISDALDKVTGELDVLYAKKSELDANPVTYDASEYKKCMRKLKEHTELLIKIDSRIGVLSERLKVLDQSTKCHACHQEISKEEHAQQKEAAAGKKEELEVAKSEVSGIVNELEEAIAKFERQVTKYNAYMEQVRDLNSQIQMAERTRDNLNEEFSKERVSQADKIAEAKAEMAQLWEINEQLIEKLQNLQDQNEYLQMIGVMLQDKGIKAMLIKRFVPIINHAVNNYLSQLGLFVRFSLDENFDETIQARGIDTLGYHNFSEGEKLRMDMALLLAWRDVARMQGNVSTNLLIFDEIFDSSLDSGGAEALADLLGETKDMNVFIITHTPEKIVDKVRSTIRIDRVDGFSKLV